ncbi:MAG: phytanoyl-CoA dioxygenase family protein [Okeania sp. SIO2H7]|nr:phytanoyl-CoA dioxygenase family protein [Okeania sp. SIO2H7]
MDNLISVKEEWEKQGFCIFPQFVDSEKLNKLQIICENIFQKWLAASSDRQEAANTSNMAFLTDPIYYKKEDYNSLKELLEFIAEPRILQVLKFLGGDRVFFHNTQYFFKPADKSWRGIWHRDTQFLASDSELEKERINYHTGVHFRIAFLKDDYLEYIPGSQKRWDTPEEYEIRKEENGKSNQTDNMPGKQKIILEKGDALLFHAWGIHRGVYDLTKPRSTLDLLYVWGNP